MLQHLIKVYLMLFVANFVTPGNCLWLQYFPLGFELLSKLGYNPNFTSRRDFQSLTISGIYRRSNKLAHIFL